MTPSLEQIPSALLASLYGVLDDQERWPEFLRELCDFVGTTFASLVSCAFDPPVIMRSFLWGLSDEDAREYIKSWVARDPWAGNADISDLVPGTVARGEEFCPDEELEKNEAYVGFLKARNMHYGAGAFLFKNDRIATVLSVSRSKQVGSLTERELDRIRSLVPHLQRVLRIQDETTNLATQLDILRLLFDQTAVGLIFLDQSGAVLAVNNRARAVMDSGGLLCAKDRVLRSSCQSCDIALRQEIRRALDPFENKADGEILTLGPQRSDHATGGPALRLLVVPTRPGERLTPSSGSPAAIVHIIDPAAAPWIDRETLRRIFLLSKAEAAVAASLACGLSVAETAECLHVSHHTVRSHLKTLFLKTGTTQQSALVSLILRLHSPLDSGRGGDPDAERREVS
jgi:DNA-binding CsgD family transcriptional regulator